MNSEVIIKQNIENALNNFLDDQQSLRVHSTIFLNTLGYHSGLIGSDKIDKPRYDRIKEAAKKTANPCERLCIEDWKPFSQILQVRDAEIKAQLTDASPHFESKAIDTELRSSYMFIAMPLAGEAYTRTQLSNITRFIGMRIPQPFMMIFRYSDVLTLAIINRRSNLRDTTKQVLEKVTLIKDINLDSSKRKRAHIDILSELHSQLLIARRDVTNFDTLHDAWEKVLDTEELNNDFYNDIEKWYDWAITECKFPDKENKMQVIRMITRLLFIWFLKEKNLVPSDIFEEKGARAYLNNFDFETPDYYQAILQNLFFATLNTPIRERTFRESNDTNDTKTSTTGQSSRPSRNPDHRNSNKYRYVDLLHDGNAFLEHLKQVPFVNGGLFDSLDSFKGQKAGGKRVDCFTDWPRHRQRLHVPAKLFFQEEKGLYEIFERYKFTVEENTPVEQEVALDPELLGQAFENLLGVYNPETEELARKETGSFYTRRNVVDYMVDEALIAHFLQKVIPGDGDTQFLEERLRDDLLAYDQLGEKDKSNDHMIYDSEIEPMIQAIDELKILDPAVGSGAFPMGILNKLVLILKKLDPKNKLWKQQQIEQAKNFTDPTSKKGSLEVIDEVFSEANQYNNYGRKLYLIQNCLYGVDIQPIAVTIAKLRFFISLIIEQEANGNRNANYGIRPLPNLETKLVAANTLIGLKELRQPDLQLLLENDSIQQLRQKIEDIRLKYFSENNRQDKLDYITDEEKCREQLATALATEHATWCKQEENKISAQVKQVPKKQARQQLREKLQKAYKMREAKLTAGVVEAKRIADWNPYDQNDKADFFDPKWMFGIEKGFDITIGNPPYVRVEAGNDDPILRQKIIEMRQQIEDSKQYETLFEKWDLFIPFIERSYKLLKPCGFTTLIVSDAYCHTNYSLKSQEWFLAKSKILRFDFCGKVPLFGPVGVRNVIFLFQKTDGSDNKPERRVHVEKFGKVHLLPTDRQKDLTHRTFFPEDTDVEEFFNTTVALSEICYVSYGLRPSSKKEAEEKFVTADVVSKEKDHLHCKPFVEGKHLDTWLPQTNLWLEWGSERSPSQFYTQTFPEMYEIDEKIIAQRSPGSDLKVCYDNQYLVFTPSSVGFILWHDLSGIKNESIQKQTRYRDEKIHPTLPRREELEEISHRFALKFLLGVMNSSFACDFLRANRRSNIHIYPDDWKQLPIPDVPPEQQTPIVALVDKILAAKQKGLERKVARLEKKLDEEVSVLYGVEDEEGDE